MNKNIKKFFNYVNGEWHSGSGKFLESINPARHLEVVGHGMAFTEQEVGKAVTAADRAYDLWRDMSLPKRAEYFRRLILKLGDPEDQNNSTISDLAKLISLECGKTLNEARADVVEGMHMIDTVFARGRLPIGDRVPSEFQDKLCYTERMPRGVTAVISPWNFPFAIPWWMMGPALIMGNTVVFKPAEQTALVGYKIAEMCSEVGFPPGVINVVHGRGEVGEALVRDQRVRQVLFTGSYEVGRKIKRICAEDDELDKMLIAETGSKSGLIIFDDMFDNEDLLALASTATYQSAFRTTGQRCVSAGRVFVPRKNTTVFVNRLMHDIESKVRAGDPFDAQTFMGPLIDSDAVKKVETYNELVREYKKGVSILLPGETDLSTGYFAKPFVYLMDRYDSNLRTMTEEVFGPHIAIIPVDDVDEAVRSFADAPYNLAMSVLTQTNRWHEVFRRLRHKGLFYVNLPHVGAEVQLPFGGTRRSGTGMPSAVEMFNHVSHPVAVTINMGSDIRMAQGLK